MTQLPVLAKRYHCEYLINQQVWRRNVIWANTQSTTLLLQEKIAQFSACNTSSTKIQFFRYQHLPPASQNDCSWSTNPPVPKLVIKSQSNSTAWFHMVEFQKHWAWRGSIWPLARKGGSLWPYHACCEKADVTSLHKFSCPPL